MKIAIAQINLITGDLKGNFKKIIRYIKRAIKAKADIIVFPETAITGYCCGALFEYEDFIKENIKILNEIAKMVPKFLNVIIGFIDFKGKKNNGYLNITNSVALLNNGIVKDSYDKVFLANRDHHEDKKYFIKGKKIKIFETYIKGKKVKLGTPICEDAWIENCEYDVIKKMKELGADIILSVNNSYFHFGKYKKRFDIFKEHAISKKIPVIMVNAVGIGDIVKNIIIYDGSSLAFNEFGELLIKAKRFKEELKFIEIFKKNKKIKKINFEIKYKEIFNALLFEQKELFKILGIKNAQVHLSGGIDSAVAAVIAVKALGNKNTILISNPTEDNKEITKNYAKYIAKELDCKLYWNPTQNLYEKAVLEHEKSFSEKPSISTKACMQAVLRTAQGISATHTFKSGIISTGNHTEIVLGWSTFHDIGSVGVHAPLGDLTKIEVYKLAEYINSLYKKEIIPEDLYSGKFKPAAELADSEFDPIDYNIMSGICAEIIRNRRNINELLDKYKTKTLDIKLFPNISNNETFYEYCSFKEFKKNVIDAYNRSKISVFKSAQSAPIVIISPRSRGFSSRETIINKYLF